MTKAKIHIFAVLSILILVFCLPACDEAPPVKPKSAVVQKKITFPKKPKPKSAKPAAKPAAKKSANEQASQAAVAALDNEPGEPVVEKIKHYDARGKIDPFKALIQGKQEGSATAKPQKPKRILTPLEKIDLSQIKLVAVIEMKGKTIAMVEESSGKGYEVGVGTYIGRNEGRVAEIRSSSIIVRELVRDFKGRLKEREQEIKLNKLDGE